LPGPMREAPLLGPYRPDDVLAWENGRPLTSSRFVSDVARLAEELPAGSTVFNLARNRYRFLLGFGAALLRGQITLLPQTRAPKILAQIARDYPDSYCLTDSQETVEGLAACRLVAVQSDPSRPPELPNIFNQQVAAVAFTSGSTGKPRPNLKPWGSLVSVARDIAARTKLQSLRQRTFVATVPHEHMFGLEASIMLPIQSGFAFHTGRPFFPEDVRTSLGEVPPGRILVTTPVHLRACVAEGIQLPPMDFILSATDTLPVSLARQAEDLFHTEVYEIYGFAEGGSVATRRTVVSDSWELLDGVQISKSDNGCTIRADYLPGPVPFPDQISFNGPRTFVFHGRIADFVNIAGHRASLGNLNQKLNEIEGVEDGVFLVPEQDGRPVTRLTAFVVAPGKSAGEILDSLRAAIAPALLPRPLHLVSRLPRNDVGKLTREALLELARRMKGRGGSA
jgi:acyl-coenzyme A synthetase/AMP-(fatty) acid ligase